ncbi:DNA polymerase III subunit gamma/tau [Qingshengfaniella alkalisoli]|uniref:DNA polymerase III subunit gamma/tau n=1 Tax=Qingshengfaniella alkalisoli TaxID=2599296 RepID=A0A5B8I5L9_9RHOB|nr:DNA polymerase III subunit gamma/tau [Qingshengfaniella alkalisoli]QDY68615.1 DNA polymerase III subunit gamma/tau [Qingshengfaniella alkalisoli]
MAEQSGYQVLARKYRPETFADLVGQDAMVRTLKNAFKADRIAQAFIMTGIRGTGKTTTARIIAKGMNCTGSDGQGGPTTEPCGKCPQCVGIAKGTHVDVIEMDGASQTRIDDIRANVLDSVTYAPAESRYKIYIIDEVHMLSTSAFNALLKTLEEPPAHVKFIFATTEIRKVPVTVLSRCQRFDLRRIEPEDMLALLRRIADTEKAEIADDALALITRAAEGSARDATSLLDQAISHGAGETTAEQVRSMLGLADRGRILDLFDLIMQGKAGDALNELSAQYSDGADPLSILRDLAEVAHWLSVMKVTPAAADDPTLSPDARERGRDMADRLSLRLLGRMWQMLLKSIEEVSVAPNGMMAAEMAIIRMTHVADLPPPEELIRKLQNGGTVTAGAAPAAAPAPTAPQQPRAQITRAPTTASGAATAPRMEEANPLAHYAQFDQVVELIRSNRDVKLLIEVETCLRLVSYSPGRISFAPTDDAPSDLAQRLGSRLQAWTGARWAVSVEAKSDAATISETRDAAELALKQEAAKHPMVAAVFKAFPGAKISHIRTPEDIQAKAAEDALPEVEDDWDPFEDD